MEGARFRSDRYWSSATVLFGSKSLQPVVDCPF